MQLEFGKYKGRDVRDVPADYLEWLAETREREATVFRRELDRRVQNADAQATWLDRVITAGQRALAKTHHPDAGGKLENMVEINNAADALKDMVRKAGVTT